MNTQDLTDYQLYTLVQMRQEDLPLIERQIRDLEATRDRWVSEIQEANTELRLRHDQDSEIRSS